MYWNPEHMKGFRLHRISFASEDTSYKQRQDSSLNWMDITPNEDSTYKPAIQFTWTDFELASFTENI